MDFGAWHQPEDRGGAGNVEKGDKRGGDVDRARQGSARILDLVSHDRAKLEAGIGKGDRSPQIQRRHVLEIRSDALQGDRGSRTAGKQRMETEANQHRTGNVGAEGTDVL